MYRPGMDTPPAAQALLEAATTAQGMVWSSPLYNGSVSGSFKNVIDWLHLLGDRDPPYLTDQVIGLVTTAGGTQALQAFNTMEFIVRALRAAFVAPLRQAGSAVRPNRVEQGEAGSEASHRNRCDSMRDGERKGVFGDVEVGARGSQGMALEDGQQEASLAQGSVQVPGSSRSISSALVGSEVVVAEVESALVDLLRCYRDALKFAIDMPVLGRCEVSGPGFRWRWGARFYTRLYVETHVRKHLQAIRSQLRLELLATTAPEERDQITSLEADLAGKVEPLLGWRRLVGVITRLPPVAAVLPVLSAVAAFPLGGEISWQAVLDAVVVLVATAVVVWVLLVWPSIRLGFRVKRAIFCGGRDLRHPLWSTPGEVQWEGFASAKVYDDAGRLWVDLWREVAGRKQRQTTRQAFPTSSVYRAEDAVY